MAVLFKVLNAPVEEFFYATPPRWVISCVDYNEALDALKEKRCKYALVPEGTLVPETLEVRARRPGFVLFQRKGQVTKSDRRARRCKGAGPTRPYVW